MQADPLRGPDSPDPVVHSEVRRIYLELGVWDPTETDQSRRQRVRREALRLTELIRIRVGQLPAPVPVPRPGSPDPDTASPAAMSEAWALARSQIIVEELYSHVDEALEEEMLERLRWIAEEADQDRLQAALLRDPTRWLRGHVTITPLATSIVNRCWPHASMWKRILAKSLIAQHLQDELPTPATVADPLFAVFDTRLEEALTARES
ncbi:hypothetical protein ACWDUL_20295 [Nocardia niigatensis]